MVTISSPSPISIIFEPDDNVLVERYHASNMSQFADGTHASHNKVEDMCL